MCAAASAEFRRRGLDENLSQLQAPDNHRPISIKDASLHSFSDSGDDIDDRVTKHFLERRPTFSKKGQLTDKQKAFSEMTFEAIESRVVPHEKIEKKLYKSFRASQEFMHAEHDSELARMKSFAHEAAKIDSSSLKPTTEELANFGVHFDRGKRRSMEDFHLTGSFDIPHPTLSGPLSIQVSAVFDGHTTLNNRVIQTLVNRHQETPGETIAKHARDHLLDCLKGRLTKLKGLSDGSIWNALKLSLVDLNKTIPDDLAGGTTATVVLRIEDNLWCIQVGDSRAFVVDDKGIITALCRDASPKIEKFKRSLENRGGCLIDNRVEGSLAITRSLGDFSMEGVISSRGEILKLPLKEKTQYKLVLSSDGVFTESATTIQVGSFIRDHFDRSNQSLAEAIIDIAKKARATDNMLVMIQAL